MSSANPSVLAFVRSAPDRPDRGPVNPVLCVHNLSRMAQPAELHVERWDGRQPIELLGRVAFPLIGTDPYPVTARALRIALLRTGLTRPSPARRPQPVSATGTRTASSSAACSGFTMLISTPVPSSKPATVVSFGTTWTCQWYGSGARYGAEWKTRL